MNPKPVISDDKAPELSSEPNVVSEEQRAKETSGITGDAKDSKPEESASVEEQKEDDRDEDPEPEEDEIPEFLPRGKIAKPTIKK